MHIGVMTLRFCEAEVLYSLTGTPPPLGWGGPSGSWCHKRFFGNFMCHKSPPQAEIFRECPFKRSLNTLVYTLKTQKFSRLRRANSLHFPLCMCLNPKIFAPAASKISVACIRPQIPQTVPATGKIPASPLYTLSKLEHFHVCDGAKYSLYSGGKCCAINSPPQTRFFF